MKKEVKLSEIIKPYIDKTITIEYRQYEYETNGNYLGDDFFGYCKWENGKLISCDGDNYSLDDVFCGWIFDLYDTENIKLTVWEKVTLLKPDEIDKYLEDYKNGRK